MENRKALNRKVQRRWVGEHAGSPRKEGGNWGAGGLVRDEALERWAGAKSCLVSQVRISISILRAMGGL